MSEKEVKEKEVSEEVSEEKKKGRISKCTCIKSKCIKKYCECFAANRLCNVYCRCRTYSLVSRRRRRLTSFIVRQKIVRTGDPIKKDLEMILFQLLHLLDVQEKNEGNIA